MFSRVKHPCQRPPCYFAWGCFRYFSWEREPRRPCGCLSRDDLKGGLPGRSSRAARPAFARWALAWQPSLRNGCPAGQTANWRKGWDSNPRYPCRHAGFQDRCLKPLGHPSKPMIPRAKKQLRPDIEKPFATEFATQIFRGCDMRLLAGPNAKSRRRSNADEYGYGHLALAFCS